MIFPKGIFALKHWRLEILTGRDFIYSGSDIEQYIPMKPLSKLAETFLKTGELLELLERDGSFFLVRDGVQIASSFSHGSDDAAAEIAASPVKKANQPAFLIDGLDLGFRLDRLVQEINREKAGFVVAEPVMDIVHWHRTILQDLHPGMLDDPRVSFEPMKALEVARRKSGAFHGILLKSVHERCELTVGEASDFYASLRQGGLLIIAISKPDTKLKRNLAKAGFDVSEHMAPVSHKGKKTSFHTLILGKKGRFMGFSQRR